MTAWGRCLCNSLGRKEEAATQVARAPKDNRTCNGHGELELEHALQSAAGHASRREHGYRRGGEVCAVAFVDDVRDQRHVRGTRPGMTCDRVRAYRGPRFPP